MAGEAVRLGRLGMARDGWGVGKVHVGEGRGWLGWLIRAHYQSHRKFISTYGKFQPSCQLKMARGGMGVVGGNGWYAW